MTLHTVSMIGGVVCAVALAAPGCGGPAEPAGAPSDCEGKCDSYVDFRGADFELKSEIRFDSPDSGQQVLAGEIVHGADAKRHVYLIDAPYGMHITLDVKIHGYTEAQVGLYGPANEHGVFHTQDLKEILLPTRRRGESEGRVIVGQSLGDTSLRPFGLHAIVIGPADDLAFRQQGKGAPIRWSYEITVGCLQHCAPSPPTGLTRYPLYFAHGFNASRFSWVDLFSNRINPTHPAWRMWANFSSVPAHEPLEMRADQLRRNLTVYLNDLWRWTGPGEAFELPAGETHWRMNLIAHSMGGLDSRYLIGHPRFNELCGERICTGPSGETDAHCCVDAHGLPESCCAPGPGGERTLPWRNVIASVTTLSTPHRGSSFADWGLAELKRPKSRMMDWFVNWVMATFLDGLIDGTFSAVDPYRLKLAEQTLRNLSTDVEHKLQSELTPPRHQRYYSWACATSQQTCDRSAQQIDPPLQDAPRIDLERCPEISPSDANIDPSCYLLPPPKPGAPSIFSWAGVSCMKSWAFGWGCGNATAPALMLSQYVMQDEGPNDGVVSVSSAKHGIFMGIKPRDHFEWSSDKGQFADFHLQWIDRLRRAGY